MGDSLSHLDDLLINIHALSLDPAAAKDLSAS